MSIGFSLDNLHSMQRTVNTSRDIHTTVYQSCCLNNFFPILHGVLKLICRLPTGQHKYWYRLLDTSLVLWLYSKDFLLSAMKLYIAHTSKGNLAIWPMASLQASSRGCCSSLFLGLEESLHSMTVSQYTENICVSTNSLMKGRSLALKDSTKESFISRLTLSGVCTSVIAWRWSLAQRPPRYPSIVYKTARIRHKLYSLYTKPDKETVWCSTDSKWHSWHPWVRKVKYGMRSFWSCRMVLDLCLLLLVIHNGKDITQRHGCKNGVCSLAARERAIAHLSVCSILLRMEVKACAHRQEVYGRPPFSVCHVVGWLAVCHFCTLGT